MNKKFLRNFLRNRNALQYKIFMKLGLYQEDKILYQTDLAKMLKKTSSTINYHITKFYQEGLINKKLELTGKGMRLFRYLWENADKKILRAHNIQIKFILRKCPTHYIERYSDKIIQIITNTRYRGFKSQIKSEWGNITLMLYSKKKIICVLKDIFADTDEEISAQVQLVSMDLKEKIELEFEGIEIDTYECVKIQSSHIALLDSILSESLSIKGFTYESKELALDKSNGRYESELTNPQNNLGGIEFVKDLEDKIRNKLNNSS